MQKRMFGVATLLVVMLALLGANTASAAAPVSNSGSSYIPVEINADINDQPAVFSISEIATDPDGDPLTLVGADYPCGYTDDTHFNYWPWGVGNQELCSVTIKDDEGSDLDTGNDNYVSVLLNITTVSGPPPNTVPTAAFTATGGELSASFDASASSDPDVGDSIVSYSWDFGDSSSGTGVTASHSYSTAGTYSVTLTVTDSQGAVNSVSHDVTVTAPPPPVGPVEIFVSDATVTETDPAQGMTTAVFQVTLSRSTDADITLHYGTFWIPFVSGQALPGSDYVMTIGNLVIPAGQTSGQISVTVKADNRKEANEIFFLLSFSCDEGVVQEDHVAVGTIINDD